MRLPPPAMARRPATRLSERRAASVADALAAHGIAHERIVTQGFGEQHPIAANANAGGRRDNRRAEVTVR